MSTILRPQRRRLASRRRNGQSIPIIALMIVVLIAMIGLSVDVGNTFSHERQAVSASNAAAVAAMTTYLKRTTNAITDAVVYQSVKDTLVSNGITPGNGTHNTVQVAVYYLNAQGHTLDSHPDQIVEGSGQTVPSDASFIQVKINGQVDTSFARVVGRNDLPISAASYATTCAMNTGIYPIGVDVTLLDTNKFNSSGINQPVSSSEFKTLTSGPYRGYTQRRIYVRDGTPGNFGWLRWMDSTPGAASSPALTASMVGDGNAASGFEEAPWPSDFSTSAPAGYPINPGIIDVGDWVWGTAGWKNSSSLDAAIQQHINNGTRMIMPIYSDYSDDMVPQGSNVKARINRLGVFVIIAQGTQTGKSPISNASGNGPYFDMVYLGDPTNQYTACTATAPPSGSNNLELAGSVSFYPEYAIIPDNRAPVQYIVVLDTSGSMSANFDGQCNTSGLEQCAGGNLGPATTTGTGTGKYWNPQNQRRIYVAKKALESLVNLTNMPGNVDYTTTRPPDQMGVVWFTESVSSSNIKTFSSVPADLKTFITNSNSGYFGNGGTNGAAALYRASLMYGAAPSTITYNGTTYTYKRVVIFVTDGVSNTFLKTSASNLSGGSSSANTYPSGSFCAKLGNNVVENATCQTTDGAGGSKYSGWDRPITQMINVSGSNLRNTTVNAEVFVIALSNVSATGLNGGVSSSPSYYYSAKSLTTNANGTTNVDDIIAIISSKVKLGDCVPGPNGSATNVLTSGQSSPSSGLTYPNVGKVVIYNSTTPAIETPIVAASDGSLSYYFPSVPAGTYTMEAWLYYYDPHDRTSRVYGMFWAQGAASNVATIDVSPTTQMTSFSQRIDNPITLKLSGEVCAP